MDMELQLLKTDFELRAASLKSYFTEGVLRACSRAREVAQRRQTVELDPLTQAAGQRDSVEEEFIRHERIRQLDALIARMGEKCNTILMRFARGYSMREIAEELGFKNEQSAKNAKGDCHRKLLELADEL